MGNFCISIHAFEKQNVQKKILKIMSLTNLTENNWHFQILEILLNLVKQ